ncbi:hypothetical protein C7424_2616 [Pantoea ananatis]|nr:hypothetical protein C7424_2616 [Pantoea ananatis]
MAEKWANNNRKVYVEISTGFKKVMWSSRLFSKT